MIRFAIGFCLLFLAASVADSESIWYIIGFGTAGIGFMLWGFPHVVGASGWTE
jgi:hypothetical protein